MEGFKIKRIVGLQNDQEITMDDPFYMNCPEWSSPWDFNDKVLIDSKYYKELAIIKKFDGKQSHRAVIAVKYNDRKIYRMFYPQSLGDNFIGLTQTSIQELGMLKHDEYKEISVEVIKQKRVLPKSCIVIYRLHLIPTIMQLCQSKPH